MRSAPAEISGFFAYWFSFFGVLTISNAMQSGKWSEPSGSAVDFCASRIPSLGQGGPAGGRRGGGGGAHGGGGGGRLQARRGWRKPVLPAQPLSLSLEPCCRPLPGPPPLGSVSLLSLPVP